MAIEDVLPTIILVAVVYFAYRWLTGSKTPTDPFHGVRRDMVEAVTSAFPDVPVDSVVYSLTRTRSAQSTSEIILERGTLPPPPPGFAIPDRLRPAAAVPVSVPPSSSSKPAAPSKPQSLIDRYNLGSKLDAAPAEDGGKWEATRESRERDLRARKEKMILEARRKMLEKQKAQAPAPAAAE